MQPFFKSTYGSIVPFSSILAMTATGSSSSVKQYNVKLLSGGEVATFTFNNLIDHDEQIKNYETWLVNQYQRSLNENYCVGRKSSLQ